MKKILTFVFSTVFIVFIIISPEICISGAKTGLIICSNVIIPSLFPFTMCTLFIMRTEVLSRIKIINTFAVRFFNQSGEMFCVLLLSMLGGYPVGARLIRELAVKNKISEKDAHFMQCYCVNAGPAFIVVAVGSGILNSRKFGMILLFSHILSASILALIFSRFFKRTIKKASIENPSLTISENFISSTADASNSVLSICSFVVLFSVIISYIKEIPILKSLIFLLEVTTAVSNTNNLLLISFVLGFSCISVWLQVYAASGDIGVNFPLFLLSRILHGGLSVIITSLWIKFSHLNITTLSNNINIKRKYTVSGLSISFSICIMLILLIISITSEKHSRKIANDMI